MPAQKEEIMRRHSVRWVSFCTLTIFLCSCVTRTVVRQPATTSKSAYRATELSSLSDYIRGVYKLSSEATKQIEQRTALLSQVPDVAGLVTRAEQDPSDVDARSRVVAEYMSRKLYWAAYELLTNAMVTKPNDAEMNLNLAIIWDSWGEYNLALQHGERALVNGAASAQAYETVGRIHLHRKSPAEAIVWYNRAVQQTPSAPVLANLGYSYMLRSEWQEAKLNLEKAIELDSTLQEAHNNLAIVLARSGDSAAALQQLMTTSRPAVALNNMGVLYLQEKKLRQAEDSFRESLRLEPNYELAERNLQALQPSNGPPSIIRLAAFGSGRNADGNEIVSSDSVQAPAAMEVSESNPAAEANLLPLDFSGVDIQLQPIIIQEPAITSLPADQVGVPAAIRPEQNTTDPEAPSIIAESAFPDATPKIVSTSSNQPFAPPTAKPHVEIRRLERRSLNMAGIAGLVLITGFVAFRRKFGE
jgi:tetratricopeptide (TPR) repeat protein